MMHITFQKNKLLKLYIPIVHILISLLFEFFTWHETGLYDPYIKTVESLGISYDFERILLLFISKTAGIVFLFVFWRFIEYLLHSKDKQCIAVLCIASILCLIEYPSCYLFDPDSPIIYYMSIGYHPDYYHGFYAQVWYNACLTVLRHPVVIPLFQSAAFMMIIRYISYHIEKMGRPRLRLLPYAVLILPPCYDLMLSPSLSSLRFLLTAAILIVCIVHRKELFPRENPRIIVKRILFALGLLILLHIPQAAGSYTYCGHDVYLEKQWDLLSVILKDADHNVTYNGAETDLVTIDHVIPVETLVKYSGSDAFHCENYEKTGKPHCSLLSYEEQCELIHSIRRLKAHNPSIVMEYRISDLLRTLDAPFSGKSYDFADSTTLSSYAEVQTYQTENIEYGVQVISESFFTEAWYSSSVVANTKTIVDTVLSSWYSFCSSLSLVWLLFAMLPAILITGILSYIKKQRHSLSAGVHAASSYFFQKRDSDILVVCALFIWLLTFLIVFMKSVITEPNTDYHTHMLWAKYIMHYIPTGFSYFLWHLLVWITFVNGSTISTLTIEGACALISATVNLIVYLIICKALSLDKKNLTALWALLLCTVMPIYLPFFNNRIYLGQGSPVSWHNPTNLMVKPFAILSFFLFVRMIDRIHKGECIAKKEYACQAFLLFLSVLAKPSYVQGIAPALIIYVFLLCIYEKWKNVRSYFFLLLTFAPVIPLLIVQFLVSFYGSDERSGGIGFGWFAAGYGYSKNPYISLLLVIAFPLLYTIFHFRTIKGSSEYRLIWIYVITSWLQSAILYEKGARMAEGNFTWAVQLAYTLLFLITVRDFAKKIYIRTLAKEKWKGTDVFLLLVLFCHLSSGILYIYRLLFTNMWV